MLTAARAVLYSDQRTSRSSRRTSARLAAALALALALAPSTASAHHGRGIRWAAPEPLRRLGLAPAKLPRSTAVVLRTGMIGRESRGLALA
jgi:hypothetical protein